MEKLPDRPGTLPARAPGQEPGHGAANGRAQTSPRGELFYEVYLHVAGGV